MHEKRRRNANETDAHAAEALVAALQPPLLDMQRGAGNQAVGRMIHRFVAEKKNGTPARLQGPR